MIDIEYLIKRHDKLQAEKDLYASIWQDIADYILPRKSNIQTKRSKGSKQTERLFDSTAIHANDLLAASMNSSLTSPASKWFSLKLRDESLNEDKEVADWLESCSNRIYLGLRQSNFNSEVFEAYQDLGAFGTAALYGDENEKKTPAFNGFLFKAIELSEYVIDEDNRGRVDTLFRKFEMSARNILAKWPSTAGEKVTQANEKDPDKTFEIIHAVYPRASAKTKVEKRFPWASVYFLKNEKQSLSEGGFHEFPYMVPRWGKTSGEVYGRGPGHTALPDIKTLNKAIELGLKAWAKVIDPPLKVKDDGVIGTPKLYPGGVTVVRDMENLQAVEGGIKWDVQEIKAQELRESIRRIFFSDQLQMQESPQMTATEVTVRYELMQRLLGPTLGRLESELLNPLLERAFALMYRAGSFLPPPARLLEAGAEIDIEYEGPLAKAQRAGEVVAIENFITLLGGLSQIDPTIFDVVDLEKAARHVAEIRGVPMDLLRGENDVKRRRIERMRAQQAEQAKADDMLAIEATEKLAGAAQKMQPKPGGGIVK